MSIFNIIHSIMHSVSFKTDGKTDSTKNIITFLSGTLLWCIVWVLLVTFKNSPFFHALKSVFIVCVIADIAAISYTYKSYYGRSIIYEAGQSESWKFDQKQKNIQ